MGEIRDNECNKERVLLNKNILFNSDAASSDNQDPCQDLGYPGQVIWTHEVTAYLDGDQSEIAYEDDTVHIQR